MKARSYELIVASILAVMLSLPIAVLSVVPAVYGDVHDYTIHLNHDENGPASYASLERQADVPDDTSDIALWNPTEVRRERERQLAQADAVQGKKKKHRQDEVEPAPEPEPADPIGPVEPIPPRPKVVPTPDPRFHDVKPLPPHVKPSKPSRPAIPDVIKPHYLGKSLNWLVFGAVFIALAVCSGGFGLAWLFGKRRGWW